MKLRITILPLLIFALFGYSAVTLDRVTDSGKKPLDLKAYAAQVKEDFSPVKPLNYEKLNK